MSFDSFSQENPTSPTETNEAISPRRKMPTDLNAVSSDVESESMRQIMRAKDGNESDVSDLSDNDDPSSNAKLKNHDSSSHALSSHPTSIDKRRDSVPTDDLPSKSRPEIPIGFSTEIELPEDAQSRLQLTNNSSDSILLSKKKRHAAKHGNKRSHPPNGGTISRRRSSISIRRRRRSSIVNVPLTHNIVFSPEPIVKIHGHQHELKRMSRLDSWMCAGCGSQKGRTDPRFRCRICPNVSVCDREACKEAHQIASVSTIEVIQHPDGRQEYITPLIQSNTNHDGVDPERLENCKNLQYVTMTENGEYTCSMCRMTFSEKDDYNRYRCSECDDFDACATCVWKNLYHIQGGPWLSKLLTITDVTGKSRSTCPASHTEYHDLHLVNREYVGGSSSRRYMRTNRARLARMRAAAAATTGPAHFHGVVGATVLPGPPTTTTTAPGVPAGLPPPGFGFGGFGAPPDTTTNDESGGASSPGVMDVVGGVQNIISQLGDSLSEQTSSLTSRDGDDNKSGESVGNDDGNGTGDLSLTDFQFPPRVSDESQQQQQQVTEPPSFASRSHSRSHSGRSDTPLDAFDRDMNVSSGSSTWTPSDAHASAFSITSSTSSRAPPPHPMSRSQTEPITGSAPFTFVPPLTHPSATPPPHIGALNGMGQHSYPGLMDESTPSPHALNARSTAAAGVTDWVCGVCRAEKEHEHARHRCGTCENFDVCDRLSCLVSHAHPLKVVPYDAEYKSSCVKCCRSNVTNRWLCHSCEGDISFCNKCIRKTLKIANALSDWTGTDWDAATDFVHDCLDASPHSVPQHRTFTYWSYKYCIMEDEDLRSRLVRLVERGIEHRQTTLHVLWVFLCSTSLPKTSLARVRISEEINMVCREMMARRRGEFTSAERNFVKFCLAFCYPTRYGPLFDELQATAREVLDELTRPLLQMYDDMVRRESELITIHRTLGEEHFNFDVHAQQHILPEEMKQELLEWYDHEKIDDIKATKAKDFCEKWEFHWERVLKLRMKDGKFHAGRITLNMFKEIAEELQHSFQNVIARIFEVNRKNLKMKPVSDDYDVGARAPEPKTISRAQHKSFREFSNRPDPREGYILDFLRAAVVCESEEEAIGFFRLCVDEAFKGQIINVTNGFDKEAPTNFGYRALHLNVIFESPSLSRANKGRKMIMEIQIILRDFLRIRKKMHLYNKIVRAREQWAIGRDFSKMWDL